MVLTTDSQTPSVPLQLLMVAPCLRLNTQFVQSSITQLASTALNGSLTTVPSRESPKEIESLRLSFTVHSTQNSKVKETHSLATPLSPSETNHFLSSEQLTFFDSIRSRSIPSVSPAAKGSDKEKDENPALELIETVLTLYKEKDFEGALKKLDILIRDFTPLTSNYPLARVHLLKLAFFYRGQILYGSRISESLKDFDEVLKLDPSDEKVNRLAAIHYFRLEQFAKAAAHFRLLATCYHTKPSYKLYAKVADFMSVNSVLANREIVSSQLIKELNSHEIYILDKEIQTFLTAYLHFSAQQFQDAKKTLAEKSNFRAVPYFAIQDLDQYVEALEKPTITNENTTFRALNLLIKLNPGSTELLLKRVKLILFMTVPNDHKKRKDDLATTLIDLAEIEKINSKEFQYEVNCLRSLVHFEQNDFVAALKCCSKAKQLNSTDATILIEHAINIELNERISSQEKAIKELSSLPLMNRLALKKNIEDLNLWSERCRNKEGTLLQYKSIPPLIDFVLGPNFLKLEKPVQSVTVTEDSDEKSWKAVSPSAAGLNLPSYTNAENGDQKTAAAQAVATKVSSKKKIGKTRQADPKYNEYILIDEDARLKRLKLSDRINVEELGSKKEIDFELQMKFFININQFEEHFSNLISKHLFAQAVHDFEVILKDYHTLICKDKHLILFLHRIRATIIFQCKAYTSFCKFTLADALHYPSPFMDQSELELKAICSYLLNRKEDFLTAYSQLTNPSEEAMIYFVKCLFEHVDIPGLELHLENFKALYPKNKSIDAYHTALALLKIPVFARTQEVLDQFCAALNEPYSPNSFNIKGSIHDLSHMQTIKQIQFVIHCLSHNYETAYKIYKAKIDILENAANGKIYVKNSHPHDNFDPKYVILMLWKLNHPKAIKGVIDELKNNECEDYITHYDVINILLKNDGPEEALKYAQTLEEDDMPAHLFCQRAHLQLSIAKKKDESLLHAYERDFLKAFELDPEYTCSTITDQICWELFHFQSYEVLLNICKQKIQKEQGLCDLLYLACCIASNKSAQEIENAKVNLLNLKRSDFRALVSKANKIGFTTRVLDTPLNILSVIYDWLKTAKKKNSQ